MQSTPTYVCRGFYDRKKLFWKEIEGMTLCAACGPPGGGRQEVSPRFLRHFTLLCLPPPSEAAMRTIFSTIMSGFLDTFFTPGWFPSLPKASSSVVLHAMCPALHLIPLPHSPNLLLSQCYQKRCTQRFAHACASPWWMAVWRSTFA